MYRFWGGGWRDAVQGVRSALVQTCQGTDDRWQATTAEEQRSNALVSAATDGIFGISASLKDALHNSLRSVISRARAVCCVVFLANRHTIGCKKTAGSPSRSDCHGTARGEGYAEHP